MPVNRQLWETPFCEGRDPNWHCPVCTGGDLKLLGPSLRTAITAESRRTSDHEAWEPQWDTHRFVALFVCTSSDCQEPVVCSGDAERVLVRRPADQDNGYEMFYFPHYIRPSPALIQLLPQYPVEVRGELELAFISTWSDPSAAANHIRAACERLLDHLREPKTDSRQGKRVRKSLHSRIVGVSTRDDQLGQSLLAVKWIGNAGSHTDELTTAEIYDALDIMEVVLEDLFVRNRSRVSRLVSSLNKSKGPVRRRD
jgi:hypothetical protein